VITTVGVVLTVIVKGDAVAGLPLTQDKLEVMTTETKSSFIIVEEVKVLLFVPAGNPFTSHRYDGVAPPFVGVAVKVTDVPAQILVPGEAAIVTLAGSAGLTDIVIIFEVAGLPVTHCAFEVISTVIISPFARVEEVKVLLFVPTLPPFTFH
jgi:hypothetical protein